MNYTNSPLHLMTRAGSQWCNVRAPKAIRVQGRMVTRCGEGHGWNVTVPDQAHLNRMEKTNCSEIALLAVRAARLSLSLIQVLPLRTKFGPWYRPSRKLEFLSSSKSESVLDIRRFRRSLPSSLPWGFNPCSFTGARDGSSEYLFLAWKSA